MARSKLDLVRSAVAFQSAIIGIAGDEPGKRLGLHLAEGIRGSASVPSVMAPEKYRGAAVTKGNSTGKLVVGNRLNESRRFLIRMIRNQLAKTWPKLSSKPAALVLLAVVEGRFPRRSRGHARANSGNPPSSFCCPNNQDRRGGGPIRWRRPRTHDGIEDRGPKHIAGNCDVHAGQHETDGATPPKYRHEGNEIDHIAHVHRGAKI